jgi:hypothetical protein
MLPLVEDTQTFSSSSGVITLLAALAKCIHKKMTLRTREK